MDASSFLHPRWAKRWPAASLRSYLVGIILLATLPIGLLMAYQLFNDERERADQVQQMLRQAAASLGHTVEREITSSVDALEILAAGNEWHGAYGSDPPRLPKSQMRPSWRGLFLLDRNGRMLEDTAAAGDGVAKRLAAIPELRQMAANPKPLVSNLLPGGGSVPHLTAISVPVIEDGQLRYVLGAWLDASVWQQLLERAGAPAEGFTSIFGRDYRLIARSLAPQQYVGERLPEPAIESFAGRPAGVHRTAMLEGGSLYGAWQLLPGAGWGVGVAMPSAPLDAERRRAVVTALGTALSCLVLGVVLAMLAARSISEPLRRMVGAGTGREPTRRSVVLEIAQLQSELRAARSRDQLARVLLEQKATEFEALFHGCPIGLSFAHDSECRVVMHNEAMNGLLGRAETRGSGQVVLLHEGRPLATASWPLLRAAGLGHTVTMQELEIRAAGRPPRVVLASAVPLRDEQGRVRGAIGAVIDITDRKQVEARLQQVDRRLRETQRFVDLAQEAGDVGFFHHEFDTDTVQWTPGLAKLLRREPTLLHSTLDELLQRVAEPDRLRVQHTIARLVAAGQEKETIEFRVERPDGLTRWLACRVLLLFGDDGLVQRMVGVVIDIDDQKQAEQAKAALAEREVAARLDAEASNRAKDEFLAMLGHELRNPLSGIAAGVEVLNRVDGNGEGAASARTIIARQTRHLSRMMDDLLDVARAISGKILLERQRMDLAALVRRVSGTLQVTGASAQHRVHLETDEAWIDADATRIEQVVSNLLTNALKYTPANGRIDARVRAQGSQVLLEVQDTGPGIEPALLPHVFDLFVQGKRALDRSAGGLGIGLTLVRRLVELHGGSISVDSSPAGTVFKVRLARIDKPVIAARTERRTTSRPRRIVVIEDNEDAGAALCAVLELDGHSVWVAADGAAGLNKLLDTRPDVAVVDIGLPGLTGYEVAKRSREAGYAGLMIAVSGYGQEADISRARASGFDSHMVKPVNLESLRELIEEAA